MKKIFFLFGVGLLILGCANAANQTPTKDLSIKAVSDLDTAQVYQRDANDKATINFSGTASFNEGSINMRVLEGAKIIQDWAFMSDIVAGGWSGKITDLPTGGPYHVDFQVFNGDHHLVKETSFSDLYVGDLWVLAGQSNMEGHGYLTDKVEEPSPLVHVMASSDNWEIAKEPLHWMYESPDPAHWQGYGEAQKEIERLKMRENRIQGAGLALPFAKFVSHETGVPIGLIPCALGGRTIQQWSPEHKGEGGLSLYGSMLRRIVKTGGKIKGVLWYQGESNATTITSADYKTKFINFISTLRQDLNMPSLPFLYVQLGPWAPDGNVHKLFSEWAKIQDDQLQTQYAISNVAMATAIGTTMLDTAHLDTESLKLVGRRLARLALNKAYGSSKYDIGPQFKSAKLVNPTLLRVSYTHVNKTLTPATNVEGFSIRNADGDLLDIIDSVTVDPQRPSSVLISLRSGINANSYLWYGYGLTPKATLQDSEELGAPAFGPYDLVN